MVGCVSVIFGGLFLLSPFVVNFSVWWRKANFLVPAGRLYPKRSIGRDFELFDEFALFAIDKWHQLPANSSVRKIKKVYERLVRISGVWLHFEWTWKLTRDLCCNNT